MNDTIRLIAATLGVDDETAKAVYLNMFDTDFSRASERRIISDARAALAEMGV